jgi:hypothetical protein
VTDTGGLDLDQDLAGTRSVEGNGGDLKRFAGSKGDGSANLHADILASLKLRLASTDKRNGAAAQQLRVSVHTAVTARLNRGPD